MNKPLRVGCILEQAHYKPGDQAPEGYLAWHEWAEVLALVPHAPLFGNTSGKKAGTHWLVFMKPNVEVTGKPPRGAAGAR